MAISRYLSSFFFAEADAEAFADADADGIAEGKPEALADGATEAEPAARIAVGRTEAEAVSGTDDGIAELAAGLPEEAEPPAPEPDPLGGGSQATAKAKGRANNEMLRKRMEDLTDRARRTFLVLRE